MWEQVKCAMVECVREVCGSMRELGGKNPKSVWWRLLGKECWQLAIKRQKRDVWKRTERRRERLKGV